MTGGRFGGIERLILVLAKLFLTHVDHIDFVLTNTSGEVYPRIPKDLGYGIANLGSSRLRGSLPGLIKYLKNEKPDYLFSGSATLNVYAVLAKALSFSATKTVSGVFWMLSEIVRSEVLLFRLIPFMTRVTSGLVFAFIADSKDVANDFSKTTGISNSRIKVINDPIPIDDIVSEAGEDPPHRFFLDDHIPVVISVGRIEKEKNHLLLLKAFYLLRQERDCRLLIIGEGALRQDLIKEAKRLGIDNDVDLPGFVPSPYPYMKRSTVFALPSNHEAFSIVQIEAMALGIPTVATDCPGGVRELTGNGAYGAIVPMNDAESMAKALMSAIDNPPDREKLRKRAEDFSAKKISAQYLRAMGILR